MAQIASGEPARPPHRLSVHLVAARYGTSPAAVRGWPVDDFLDACAFLGVTADGK